MFRYVPELAIRVGTNEALNFGTWPFCETDDNGQITGPMDITGWTWRCQARPTASSTTVLLDMDVQTVGSPSLGQINIHATETAVLAAGVCSGVYDLIGTPIGGEPWGAWTSDFAIVQGVSR